MQKKHMQKEKKSDIMGTMDTRASAAGGARVGAGRKPRSPKGTGRDVNLYLRQDQIDWLRLEADRLSLRSASQVVSDWIDRVAKRRGRA